MRLIISSVVLAALLLTQFSCTRKGDGDPLVSFRSRKARLCGEWKLEKGEGYSNPSMQYGSAIVSSYFSGQEIFSNTYTGAEEGRQSYTCQVKFNSDNTFEWKMAATGNYEPGLMRGSWDFLSGNDYDQKKVKVMLKPEHISGYWLPDANLPFPERVANPIFEISILRNDKIELFRYYQLAGMPTTTGFEQIKAYEKYSFIKN
jgi:hypothetical protein